MSKNFKTIISKGVSSLLLVCSMVMYLTLTSIPVNAATIPTQSFNLNFIPNSNTLPKDFALDKEGVFKEKIGFDSTVEGNYHIYLDNITNVYSGDFTGIYYKGQDKYTIQGSISGSFTNNNPADFVGSFTGILKGTDNTTKTFVGNFTVNSSILTRFAFGISDDSIDHTSSSVSLGYGVSQNNNTNITTSSGCSVGTSIN